MIPFSRRSALCLLAMGRSVFPAERLFGTWSATAGQRTLGGTWTAEPHEEADSAWGTWSLVDRSGRRIASGTWGTRKANGKWQGQWRAEADGRGSYSGGWTAEVTLDASASMFALLQAAVSDVVSGSWSAPRRLSGEWSIRARVRE